MSDLQNELNYFTGTEHYYRIYPTICLTDGIKHLCDKAQSYWLIDVIYSYQHKLTDQPFQLWSIKVSDDNTAIIECRRDSGEKPLVHQELDYTDFPFDLEWYAIKQGTDIIVLLKSEY